MGDAAAILESMTEAAGASNEDFELPDPLRISESSDEED